jgi:hypothetical protein
MNTYKLYNCFKSREQFASLDKTVGKLYNATVKVLCLLADAALLDSDLYRKVESLQNKCIHTAKWVWTTKFRIYGIKSNIQDHHYIVPTHTNLRCTYCGSETSSPSHFCSQACIRYFNTQLHKKQRCHVNNGETFQCAYEFCQKPIAWNDIDCAVLNNHIDGSYGRGQFWPWHYNNNSIYCSPGCVGAFYYDNDYFTGRA